MAIAIVHESCIKELFKMCQCCGKPITDTHVTYVGSQMRVSWKCLGGHSGTWTSSPEVRRTPEVNSLSAATVLFTGNTITEMSNSDGCVSSHSMSPQHHMHSSLSSAAAWRTDGCMAPIFTLEDKSTETEAGCLSLQIKEEPQEELLQGPEEAAGSTLTLLAGKSEDDDNENRDTPLASTSTEHMETQAYIIYCVPSSEPTNDDQLPSSNCFEPDITADSVDWVETREDLNDLNSRYHEQLRGLLQDLNSSKQRKEEEKSWRCTECGKGFLCMAYLRQHMITHTGFRPVICTLCGKGCRHLSNLKIHLVNNHAGDNPITCTECGKPFESIPPLKSHMKHKHTGKKPFSCHDCRQFFVDRSLLKEHMSSHRDKLFSCTECTKVFVCMSSLKTHMKAHRGSQTLTSAVDGKDLGLKPEPLKIKEKQEEELLQRPEEAAGSTLTLIAEKSEDDGNGNRDTEPLASTSTEHNYAAQMWNALPKKV